ncbi:hypothetical protein HDU67_002481 [Dinochytrium kinnereticum]|nr:hypothetical protein HDU67_002481 [Dinochytrium kinnereticum]
MGPNDLQDLLCSIDAENYAEFKCVDCIGSPVFCRECVLFLHRSKAKQGHSFVPISKRDGSQGDYSTVSSADAQKHEVFLDDALAVDDLEHPFSSMDAVDKNSNSRGSHLNDLDNLPKFFPSKPNAQLQASEPFVAGFPGFYRILEIVRDTSSNGLVDKIIISKPFFEKLCNDLVPGSYRSESHIDFGTLERLGLRFIGVYGNRAAVAQYLLKTEAISKQLFDGLVSLSGHPNSCALSPGLYLVLPPPTLGIGYIIHWPEIDAFEEFSSRSIRTNYSSTRKNTVNLHRYLTKVCGKIICAMTVNEMNAFDFSSHTPPDVLRENEEEEDFGEEEDLAMMTNMFQVTSIQSRKEDFEVFPGFKIPGIVSAVSKDGTIFMPMIATSDHFQTVVIPEIEPSKLKPISESRVLPLNTSDVVDFLLNQKNKKSRDPKTMAAIRISRELSFKDICHLVKYLDAALARIRKGQVASVGKDTLSSKNKNEKKSNHGTATAQNFVGPFAPTSSAMLSQPLEPGAEPMSQEGYCDHDHSLAEEISTDHNLMTKSLLEDLEKFSNDGFKRIVDCCVEDCQRWKASADNLIREYSMNLNSEYSEMNGKLQLAQRFLLWKAFGSKTLGLFLKYKKATDCNPVLGLDINGNPISMITKDNLSSVERMTENLSDGSSPTSTFLGNPQTADSSKGDLKNNDTRRHPDVKTHCIANADPPIKEQGGRVFETLGQQYSHAATALSEKSQKLYKEWQKISRDLVFAQRIVKELSVRIQEQSARTGFDEILYYILMQTFHGVAYREILMKPSRKSPSVFEAFGSLLGWRTRTVAKDLQDLIDDVALSHEVAATVEELGEGEIFIEAMVLTEQILSKAGDPDKPRSYSQVASSPEQSPCSIVTSLFSQFARNLFDTWSCLEAVKELFPGWEADFEERRKELMWNFELQKKNREQEASDNIRGILQKLFIEGLVLRNDEANLTIHAQYAIQVPSKECVIYNIIQTGLTQDDLTRLENGDHPEPFVPSLKPLRLTESFVMDVSIKIIKIIQCGNRKMLVLCSDGATIKLFFGFPEDIGRIMEDENKGKSFQRGCDLFDYHDDEGILALYDGSKGYLTIYKFDESRSELFQYLKCDTIVTWYNDKAPDLSRILFAQDNAEEMCFIEKSGRCRVYNLITLQFRPADFYLTPDSSTHAILRGQGGKCLLVIAERGCGCEADGEEPVEDTVESVTGDVGEVLESSKGYDIETQYHETNIAGDDWDRASGDDSNGSLNGSEYSFVGEKHKSITKSALQTSETQGLPNSASEAELQTPSSKIEACTSGDGVTPAPKSSSNAGLICFVHFSSKLGQSPPLQVPLPKSVTPDIAKTFVVSLLCKKQAHLMGLDENGDFFSMLLRISVEKNSYDFEKKTPKEITKAVVESGKTSLKLRSSGRDRNSKIRTGDLIHISDQTRTITAIRGRYVSVDSPFNLEHSGEFDYGVTPRSTTNGLLGIYREIYERYPVRSLLGDDHQSRKSFGALSIFIVDVEEAQNIACAWDSSLDMSMSMSYASFSTLSGICTHTSLSPESFLQQQTKFRGYLVSVFKQLQDKTSKDCTDLLNFADCLKVEISPEHWSTFLPPLVSIGKWMTEFLCLLPLQIATTRSGQLVPLKDGVISNEFHGFDVDGVTRKITFGWLESILTYYGRRRIPVKVLSVMGLQSTGKSYMINHIVGTHFDGNAMRCTEGVWMSISPTDDAIYISLDFEGLGSVERTPQEDMLLSLLNAAASHLILYKTNFSLGRSMNDLFQMFQDGAKLFEKDKNDRLFRGHLFVQINDVSETDRMGIVQEFRAKLGRIVQDEGENNFISRLFQKRMNIEPWPLFNEPNFYNYMSKVKSFAKKIESPYANAVEWREDFKLLLAKLMICDWGSMDDNLIASRTRLILSMLPIVLCLGMEVEDPFPEDLSCRDTGELILDSEETIDLTDFLVDGCVGVKSSIRMPLDKTLKLPFDCSTSLGILCFEFLRDFSSAIGDRRNANLDDDWQKSFRRYITLFIDRRVRRIEAFVEKNLERFPANDTRVINVWLDVEKEIRRFRAAWTIWTVTRDRMDVEPIIAAIIGANTLKVMGMSYLNRYGGV